MFMETGSAHLFSSIHYLGRTNQSGDMNYLMPKEFNREKKPNEVPLNRDRERGGGNVVLEWECLFP